MRGLLCGFSEGALQPEAEEAVVDDVAVGCLVDEVFVLQCVEGFADAAGIGQALLDDGPSQCLYHVMLVLGVKDVGVDADGVFVLCFDLVKHVLNQPCLAYLAWRHQSDVSPIL